MSMGYAGAYADTISITDIQKVCPKEWGLFEKLCKDNINGGWEEYIRSLYYEDEAESLKDFDAAPIETAFTNLCESFDKKTGLHLEWGYHSSEDCGDCYDAVDGAYFSVEGVWTETPKYKKAKTKFDIHVERKMFVQIG